MNPEDRPGHLDWDQPEPPRRRRWPRNLAIAVLVLAGLFTAADRIAVSVAESQIASRIQKSQNLAAKPAVAIDGFPFLTQLIGMRLGKVTLDVRDMVRNGVQVTDLRVDLRGVKPSNGFKQATVDQLDGTAFFSWADLQKAASAQGVDVILSDGGDGKVKVTGQISVLGQQVRATLTSAVVLGDNNKISLRAVKVDTNVPGLSSQVPRVFDYTIPVGGLPLGMTLHDFRVDSDGVRVSGTAPPGVTISGSGVQ
jgi:hypothetical protein